MCLSVWSALHFVQLKVHSDAIEHIAWFQQRWSNNATGKFRSATVTHTAVCVIYCYRVFELYCEEVSPTLSQEQVKIWVCLVEDGEVNGRRNAQNLMHLICLWLYFMWFPNILIMPHFERSLLHFLIIVLVKRCKKQHW